MQRDEVAALPVEHIYVKDLWSILIPMAKGKSVLNVGAAGNVEYYLEGRRELWMHERLKSLAADLVGLDIDEDSVAFANARGEALVVGNCETAQLGRQFDLIVLSEVIEHVNAPVAAITNLVRHLKPQGKLFITTPNPTYYGTALRAVLNSPLNIYYDHVTTFFPENFAVICRRLGLKMTGVYFYNAGNVRSPALRVRSWVARQMGRLRSRMSSNFIVVIESASSR
jgi:SAM-dependent methyltransferase